MKLDELLDRFLEESNKGLYSANIEKMFVCRWENNYNTPIIYEAHQHINYITKGTYVIADELEPRSLNIHDRKIALAGYINRCYPNEQDWVLVDKNFIDEFFGYNTSITSSFKNKTNLAGKNKHMMEECKFNHTEKECLLALESVDNCIMRTIDDCVEPEYVVEELVKLKRAKLIIKEYLDKVK